MTDFLTRIAARAVGAIYQVRPVAPAHFERGRPIEDEDTEARVMSLPEREPVDAERSPRPKPMAEERGRRGAPAAAAALHAKAVIETPPPQPGDNSVQPARRDGGTVDERHPPTEGDPDSAMGPAPNPPQEGGTVHLQVEAMEPNATAPQHRLRREIERDRPPHGEAKTPATEGADRAAVPGVERTAMTTPIAQPIFPPPQPDVARHMPPPNGAAAAPPTVQVSIGTIEVRATQPQPPSPQRRVRREPALSLEAYAARRRSGP